MWSGEPRAETNRPSRCNSGLPGHVGAPWPPPVSNDESAQLAPGTIHNSSVSRVLWRFRRVMWSDEPLTGSQWTNPVQFGLLGAVEGHYRPVFATRSTDCTRSRCFCGPGLAVWTFSVCFRSAPVHLKWSREAMVV